MRPSPTPRQGPLLRSEGAFRDYASNVREADVNFFLTTDRRCNTWSIRQCSVGDSVLQFANVGAGTVADGIMAQADKLIFLIQSTLAPHQVYLNGERLAKQGLAVLAPGSDFVFANPVPHKWISISVGLDRLPPGLIDRFDKQIELHAAALLAAEQAQFAELVDVSINVGSSRSPVGSVSPLRCPNMEDELIDALTAAVMSSERHHFNHERGGGGRYFAIVRSALAGIPDNAMLHVDDLCRSIGIKERTLRRAFNKIFRMPPKRYLQLRQLNQVHAALSAPDAQGQLVMDILMRHGVTELGRFAADYRDLFGQLPSQTLRRARN